MIKSTFGANKKSALTLVLLLLTTWASAPLSDIPALCSSPHSWPKAHTNLINQSKKIRTIAHKAQLKHKEAILAYAIACAAALEIPEERISRETAEQAYQSLLSTFAEENFHENSLKRRVFRRIRRTLHESYNYLIRYLDYEETIQNERGPAIAPQVGDSLPSFEYAARLLATPSATRSQVAPHPQPISTQHRSLKQPLPRTSKRAAPLLRPRQQKHPRTTQRRTPSLKKYHKDPNGCWWITIREHTFMLVNEAARFKFPALCNGNAATFADHRNKAALTSFPLTREERLLVFHVLLKAGITKSAITRSLKKPEKFKDEIQCSARKASTRKESTRSTAQECAICSTNPPRETSICPNPKCTYPICEECARNWMAHEVAHDREATCPNCRTPGLII